MFILLTYYYFSEWTQENEYIFKFILSYYSRAFLLGSLCGSIVAVFAKCDFCSPATMQMHTAQASESG